MAIDKEVPLRVGDIKLHNRNMVLAQIYASKHNGISQSALTKDSTLRAASVFRIFSSLEEEGLIMLKNEPKEVSKLKGRKPTLYTVNPDALYLVGAELSYNTLEIGIFNFLLDRLAHVEYKFENQNMDELSQLMIELTEEQIIAAGVPRDKVVGFGLASPGIIDVKNRVLLSYDRIEGYGDFPIGEVLASALNMPVTVRNNTTVQSYYNYYHHDFGDSVFTVLLRHGINGAFINKGEMFLDSKGYSVDIAHMPISYGPGPKCSCGGEGCLQAYLFNIEGEYDDEILLKLEGLLSTDLKRLDYITDQIVYYLTVLLRSVDRLINPSSYVILTKDKEIGSVIRNKLNKVMEQKVSRYSSDLQKPIYNTTFNSLNVQKGIAELVLRDYFNDEMAVL